MVIFEGKEWDRECESFFFGFVFVRLGVRIRSWVKVRLGFRIFDFCCILSWMLFKSDFDSQMHLSP